MRSGNHRARDTEPDADKRYGRSIEEYSDEKPESDDGAREEDTEGGAGVENEKGHADGERKDETSGHLVEGGIHVFQRIVAETEVIDVREMPG